MKKELPNFESSDRKIISGMLDSYARALRERDCKAMEGLFHPSCIIHASRRTLEGEWRRFTRTREEFLTALSMQEKVPDFKVTDIVILNRGHVCGVWAEYEFYLDGIKVHEGVEGFHFVKIGNEWKIVSLIYTAELLPRPKTKKKK